MVYFCVENELNKKLKKVLKEQPQNQNNTPKNLKLFAERNKPNKNTIPIERESHNQAEQTKSKWMKGNKRARIFYL